MVARVKLEKSLLPTNAAPETRGLQEAILGMTKMDTDGCIRAGTRARSWLS